MLWLIACTAPDATSPDSEVLTESDEPVDSDSPLDSDVDTRRLHDMLLRATHNSYELGALTPQLDAGIRGLELDVHSDDGDLRIGHNWPGDGVDGDDALSIWLDELTTWSQANPDHAPIVLTVDLKDAIDLGQLNDLLPEPVDSWLAEDLRGHVIPVLSGDAGSRENYLGDRGQDPAFASNDTAFIEVHSDGAGGIWTWVGDEDGWAAHERIASGWDPAVALTDDGRVLVVHQAAAGSGLYAKPGQLDGTDITWADGVEYDSGVAPTVEWLGGDALREVHTSEWDAGQNWSWDVTWDGELAWSDNAKTDDELDETAGRVTTTDGVLQLDGAPIRWAQKAHVESQSGSDHGTPFAAASSGSDVSAWLADDRIVRIWSFKEHDPLVQLPATDTPDADWYLELTADADQ